VTTLVKGGAAVNAKADGYSPLHGAAWQGHVEVVRALLDFGAPVNAQDGEGYTPLHKAAWRGHEQIARLLLAHKADTSIKESGGLTPLEMARSAKKEAVVAVLSKAK
jgi:ankyrin repeat protein